MHIKLNDYTIMNYEVTVIWLAQVEIYGNATMHFIVHVILFKGKDNPLDLNGRSHSHAVVLALVEKLQGRRHHVYMDNFYSSPDLFTELREQGFGACGTVCINCCGLTPDIKKNLAKENVHLVAMDKSMVALKWADKCQIFMLSTLHDDSMVTKTWRTCLVEGEERRYGSL